MNAPFLWALQQVAEYLYEMLKSFSRSVYTYLIPLTSELHTSFVENWLFKSVRHSFSEQLYLICVFGVQEVDVDQNALQDGFTKLSGFFA